MIITSHQTFHLIYHWLGRTKFQQTSDFVFDNAYFMNIGQGNQFQSNCL